MRFIYPAVVSKEEDGRYHAVFPDLDTCEAYGDSLDDVLRNANHEAYAWIELEMQEDDPYLPAATDHADLDLKEGEIVRDILVIYRILEGWEE
ncbi:MAG: type II toxin-antitoxin system HicB family antitoxin [Lachnospiraceae bacterium]|nr:type II toxin-antitoxin system HicB family antitoxin [Lachnospiraceae bacterium]